MKSIFEIRPQVWQLDGTEMEVEVIRASKTNTGAPPIFTLRMRYPRIIHAEIMTHRVFSRNARSSRAVPVKTMLMETTTIPFIPWHWGANQKGMQAGAECNEIVEIGREYDGSIMPYSREEAWLEVRDRALEVAKGMMEAGYHKQIPNRLLEPFMWIDTLITSTQWSNFLWLRDHEAAEPHLRDLARVVTVALAGAKIQTLKPGEWHLPYFNEADWEEAKFQAESFPMKISAARSARISYAPFDGDASYERELERYNSLVSSDRVHASPLEHQATPDEMVTASIDLFEDENETLTPSETLDAQRVYKHKQKHGNLTGWIQFRKTVPNENHV